VGVEGDFTEPVSSPRKLANFSCTSLGPWLVTLYLAIVGFGSLGVLTLIFLADIRAGVDVPTEDDINT
jgi:hypothetical protein